MKILYKYIYIELIIIHVKTCRIVMNVVAISIDMMYRVDRVQEQVQFFQIYFLRFVLIGKYKHIRFHNIFFTFRLGLIKSWYSKLQTGQK